MAVSPRGCLTSRLSHLAPSRASVPSALLPALAARLAALGLSAAAAGFLAAAALFVHRSPCAAFGFLFRHSALLVPFFYVLGLAFLLVSVCSFITPWHKLPSLFVRSV